MAHQQLKVNNFILLFKWDLFFNIKKSPTYGAIAIVVLISFANYNFWLKIYGKNKCISEWRITLSF